MRDRGNDLHLDRSGIKERSAKIASIFFIAFASPGSDETKAIFTESIATDTSVSYHHTARRSVRGRSNYCGRRSLPVNLTMPGGVQRLRTFTRQLRPSYASRGTAQLSLTSAD
jgi:hypothetical protein